MLGFSTAYNFAHHRYRPVLRRLDHAGIFLMIAGSYTPFTLGLPGAWGWGMTAAVWSIATLGALGKLFLADIGLPEKACARVGVEPLAFKEKVILLF